MASQFDDEQDSINDINVTPFVDVVLVLLVIFMVAAPMMAKQALEVKLPSSETSESIDPKTFSLAITSEGQFLLEGKLAIKESILEFAKAEYAKDSKVQVIIASDEDAKHKYVVNAIDIIKQAGIENFAFQIERESDAGDK